MTVHIKKIRIAASEKLSNVFKSATRPMYNAGSGTNTGQNNFH